nr:MAG TPA: hypothetical protein [Bacteriophage sp.]
MGEIYDVLYEFYEKILNQKVYIGRIIRAGKRLAQSEVI